MTFDEAQGLADSDQYASDPVVAAYASEVARLRAENAGMQGHTADNCSNTYERGFQDGLAGNREALEQIKALHAENAELRNGPSERGRPGNREEYPEDANVRDMRAEHDAKFKPGAGT